ncbi:hypothetical protein AAFF_G00052680 [Aldrovandia affinis]|uniref:Uncharacterized protein n=1 Tax=Aldrovandia affinis TaxID=143900 RepID=A0AAD7T4W8_9TELE|nr:hypothetical protein AAFF_G00052680 [Aldrovandia affinis]
MASRRKQIHPLKRAGLRLLPSWRLPEEPLSASEEEEAGAIGSGPLPKEEEEDMSSYGESYDSVDMGACPKLYLGSSYLYIHHFAKS